MMKTTARRRLAAFLLTLALALSLAAPAFAAPGDEETTPGSGESGGSETNPGGSSTTAQTDFTVKSEQNLNPGDSEIMYAAVTGDNRDTRLQWVSSDTSVVEVSYDTATLADNATLRGLKPGEATVTVTALDSGVKKTIAVTVNGIALLNGDNVTVPENGTATWTRGRDFELYGTAAEGRVNLTSDKNNVSVLPSSDQKSWFFNGIREGRATVTAQPLTNMNANAGSSVQIHVTVTENTAKDIVPEGTYSASQPLRFASIESQIAAQCREMIQDAANNLVSINGLSVSTNEGTLYLGYKDADNTGSGVGSALSYNISTASVGPYLKDIYFVPNPRFTGDKATITFTGVSEGGRTFKGRISVSITPNAGTASVLLSTNEGTPLTLSGSVFSTAFQAVAGVPLKSLVFSLPSELQGTLYRNYINESNYAAKVTGNDSFTLSELSGVTFVPAAGYVGDVVISYAGYTSAGLRYDGRLTITVKQSVDGVITYNDGGMGFVTFSETDFEDYCRRVTGAKLGWVSFTLPASSQGVLHYNYGNSGASQVLVGDVFPYQGTPNISYVSMVAAAGFAGTARISFNGANENGATFTGTVEAHFQSAGGGMDIAFTCLPGSSVKITANQFAGLCQSLTGQRLHYITFQSLPDYTLGALYHNRTSAAGIGSRVSVGAKYYNSAAPYIMNLSFWATESFHGDVEIPFTGCSVSGQTFNGSLIITTGTTHSYNAVITYNTAGRSPANFVGSEFDSLCRTATNSALNYIRFTAMPTSMQGNLYFDYLRAEVPKTISTADSFYLSGEQSVSRISFLPAPGFTGSVSLPFTGWSISGSQFQGTVQINVSGGVTGTNVLYTTSGSPVRLSAYDFYNEGGGQPVYISFTSMPFASQGKLYYQYTNPTHYSWLATPGMQYGIASDPLLANLTFVPKAGYKGEAVIPYTATNTNGGTYTGEIHIMVEPAASSKYFRDLSGYSASAVSAVDFLYSQGVVNGTSEGVYSPSANIRRGDFCLMLYRAFQFSSDGTTANFSDVPASAYYAQAINVLRSQGVVQGVGGNTFRPNASISRQDAALMVQRTLKAAGLSAADGTEANLAGYDDAASVDSYAKGAVTCLLQQGFLPVSGTSLSPRAALTRSDMAVLLHRAIAQ